MKCPKCHGNMIRKGDGKGNWYFECPKCGTQRTDKEVIIGKNKE